MSQQTVDPIVDALVSDFGGNYAFALDLLESYRQDRRNVDRSWRSYFDKVLGLPAEPEDDGGALVYDLAKAPAAQAAAPAPEPVRTLARQEAPARSRALVVPPILPGDIAAPIRGGLARVVENMEASLSVPTATSIRTVPVRTLEENRVLLNKHRALTGGGKISFTHVVAWAILRALDSFPRLNDAYAEIEGAPHRIQRDNVRLGVAVDVQKKDGTRTLLVPNIKNAQKLAFDAQVPTDNLAQDQIDVTNLDGVIVTTTVAVWRNNFGHINFVMDRVLDEQGGWGQQCIMGLDERPAYRPKICQMPGRNWASRVLGVRGDLDEKLVTWEGTIEVPNPRSIILLGALSDAYAS